MDRWVVIKYSIFGLGVLLLPIGGLVSWLFDYNALAASFWVSAAFASHTGCIILGYRMGQHSLLEGGKLAMSAQQLNDQWDTQKMKAMAQFATTMMRVKQSPQFQELPAPQEDFDFDSIPYQPFVIQQD